MAASVVDLGLTLHFRIISKRGLGTIKERWFMLGVSGRAVQDTVGGRKKGPYINILDGTAIDTTSCIRGSSKDRGATFRAKLNQVYRSDQVYPDGSLLYSSYFFASSLT